MKKTNLFKVLFSSAVLMSACTTDEIVKQQENAASDLEQIRMTAKDFVYQTDSRTNFDVSSPDAAKFIWSEGDTIGIFPNVGNQVGFPIAEGANSNTAVFNGGGWALKPASTYAAYYPYVFENRNMDAIAVSYKGQKQIGNATTTHLGKYDFMAAVSSNPEAGKVNFNFNHLGALIKLDITTPAAMAVTAVTLSTDEDLFTKTGSIDLSQSNIQITAVEKMNSFKVACQDIATTEANKVATIYFMLPPVNLTGKTIDVEVIDDAARLYSARLTNITNIEAGKAYAINATININKELILNGNFEEEFTEDHQPGIFSAELTDQSGILNYLNRWFCLPDALNPKLTIDKEEGANNTSRSLKYISEKVWTADEVNLSYALRNVTEGKYEFSYYVKTNQDETPFTLSIVVCETEDDIPLVLKENQKSIVFDQKGKQSLSPGPNWGLAATCDNKAGNVWNKYTITVDIPKNVLIRFVFKPCAYVGVIDTHEIWGKGLWGVVYWFDEFNLTLKN